MELPHCYWTCSQFQKFCLGFGGAFLFASLWHLRVVDDLWEGGAHWKWARHQLTFLVVHPFLFAPAIGLTFSVLDEELLKSVRWSNWRPWLLIALLFGAFGLSRRDYFEPPPNELSRLLGFIETWIFMSLVATFIWYFFIWIIRYRREWNGVVFSRLLLAASLIALWIPFRMYSTAAGNLINQIPGGGMNPPVYFAIVVAVVVVGAMLFYAVANIATLNVGELIFAGLDLIVSVASLVNDRWIPTVFNLIEALNTNLYMIPVLALLAFVSIVGLARALLP